MAGGFLGLLELSGVWIGSGPAAAELDLVEVLDETVNANEAIARSSIRVRPVNETLNIPEAIAQALGITAIAPTETVNVAEDTVTVVEAVLVEVLDEAVNVAEAVIRAAALVRPIDEIQHAVELLARARSQVRLVAEVLEVRDTQDFTVAKAFSVDERVDIDEVLVSVLSEAEAVLGLLLAELELYPALEAALSLDPAVQATIETNPETEPP